MSEPPLSPLSYRPRPRQAGTSLPVSRVYNVLFLCEDNSCRSLMAEALLRRWGAGRFRAFSAGCRPAAAPERLALEAIAGARLPTSGLAPKSWTEFCGAGALRMDLVISVCARAAAETSPEWPGHPILAHWGIGDPAAVRGRDVAALRAYQRAYREIEGRIKLLVSLPFASLDVLTLSAELRRME